MNKTGLKKKKAELIQQLHAEQKKPEIFQSDYKIKRLLNKIYAISKKIKKV